MYIQLIVEWLCPSKQLSHYKHSPTLENVSIDFSLLFFSSSLLLNIFVFNQFHCNVTRFFARVIMIDFHSSSMNQISLENTSSNLKATGGKYKTTHLSQKITTIKVCCQLLCASTRTDTIRENRERTCLVIFLDVLIWLTKSNFRRRKKKGK